MEVEQIYTGCLAQGAYYIRDGKEAIIIDPLREIDPYLERAKKDGVKIKYIFETHFHADFVSGHLNLAEKTGATIIYGPNADTSFPVHVAYDGESFKMGECVIKVLHTPGHTMESSCFLLYDKDGKEHSIFTGDTLLLGDVGRPDLAQKANHITKEDLAGMLYDSLRIKIMPLPNSITVYPAHGAGSACGKNMMKETIDTLGNQKKVNYALRADMTKEEFVKEVTDGILAPPKYFPMNVKMNKEGYQNTDKMLANGLKPLSANELELMVNETEAIVLDVRSEQEFANAHIPNSIFIGLDGTFAPWVGELIVDVEQPLVLVTPIGREEETIIRLSRIGFDNSLGYLEGGFESWKAAKKEVDTVTSITAEEFSKIYQSVINNIFDMRKFSEYEAEHVEDANIVPLNTLNDHLNKFPKDEEFYVYCGSGYRSIIASSIMKARGFHNVVDVQGGYKAIKNTNIKVTDFVCGSQKIRG